MDSFQAKLAEQVRQYKHLYDPSSRDYRDIDVAMFAWNEIASTMGKDEAFCRKVWKNMRDRFVRAKKKIYVKSGHRRRISDPDDCDGAGLAVPVHQTSRGRQQCGGR